MHFVKIQNNPRRDSNCAAYIVDILSSNKRLGIYYNFDVLYFSKKNIDKKRV